MVSVNKLSNTESTLGGSGVSSAWRYVREPLDFARRAERVEGRVALQSLDRLLGVLHPGALSTEQSVDYVVQGQVQAEKHFFVLQAQAVLPLTCQRCLQGMDWPVALDVRLMLVPEHLPLPDDELEDDSFDPVHVGREFDLIASVEDELLLALPIAPMHEDCLPPAAAAGDGRESPFSVLKKLKASTDD